MYKNFYESKSIINEIGTLIERNRTIEEVLERGRIIDIYVSNELESPSSLLILGVDKDYIDENLISYIKEGLAQAKKDNKDKIEQLSDELKKLI
ncbi:hypothetical protein [Oceanobacillus kimchii]|uniref:Uncharacterized protein n=1 Tax=Oceanobacillus kimchii TaxID=746691 RepID=A0ABQ5TH95_9BACI|nr:hypothetical protein [Oceanobacillus kimchii]GLO66246.1 hypothetical protein MACH08_20300 [Oceanobacillus kimchii]